jgi:polyphosphate glucokinase
MSELHPTQKSGDNAKSSVMSHGLSILSVDIGGTLVKACTVNVTGAMVAEWLNEPTPAVANPENVLRIIDTMVRSLPPFARISIGFPGVVRNGKILTAPNLDSAAWRQFDLASELRRRYSVDARILNDAIVQGLGVASEAGLQCVLTLGTGLGCALFQNKNFLVQLELGQHYAFDGMNYDTYVGHKAFLAVGRDDWNSRVRRTLDAVQSLVNFDRLYIGGGNARRIDFVLGDEVTLIPRTAGITGGACLWQDDIARQFGWTLEMPCNAEGGG